VINQRIAYGTQANQNYHLFASDQALQNKDHAKVAVLVHGGGYQMGSSEDSNWLNVAKQFVDQGYVVASVNYRLFDGTSELNWPDPVTDVADGINDLYKKLGEAGYTVENSTYVGESAGADTGAFLIFSDQYDSGERKIPKFNNFIGMSGQFNEAAVPEQLLERYKAKLGLPSWEAFVPQTYDPESKKTNVMLIGGNADHFDQYAGTENSHVNTFAHFLEQNQVAVKALTLTQEGYNGHDGPLKAFGQGVQSFIQEIGRFLKLTP